MEERPILFSSEIVSAILDERKTQTRRIVKFPKHVMGTPGAVHEDGGGNWVAWSPGSHRGLAEFTKKAYPNGEGFRCPYGKPGDRLWVRETWLHSDHYQPEGVFSPTQLHYRVNATDADLKWLKEDGFKWKSPRFMPRWASRLTLEILSIRAERLQEINEQDAEAEGVPVGQRSTLPGEDIYHVACVYCDKRRNEHVGVAQACFGGHGTVFDPKTYKGGFAWLWDQINGKRAPWASNPWVWVVEFKRAKYNRPAVG